jgi:MFS family permease
MVSSLRVRNYRLFASGQVVSLTGTWMQVVAQDWLVLELSGNSATALALVVTLQFAPILVLGLYAGVLADRFDKRVLLAAVQSAMAVIALVMGLLVISGTVALWHVYVLAVFLGVTNSLDTPVRQAFVSEMVGPELLPNAVALNSAAFNSARIVGPAAGGLVIAWLGVGPAFLLNAVSYLAVLAGLARMDPDALLRGERAVRARGQVREGLRYVAGRPDLVMAMVLMGVVGSVGMNFHVTLPLLARTEFDVGPEHFGLLWTAFAGGALAGALVGTRRRGRPPATALLGFAAVFGALECAVAFAPTFTVAAALLVPTGTFLIAHNTAANARVQLGADPLLRGRVMALYIVMFFGGTTFGSLIVGGISEAYGVRAGLAFGGISVVLTAGVLAAVRSSRRSQVAR